MEIVLALIRIGLFAVFALAGLGKLLDPEGAKKAVEDFGTPDALVGMSAVLLPLAEIVIAVGFLLPGTSWFASIIGLALLLIFTGGMAWQFKKGNAPDCHCFGQIHSEPVGAKSLIRNLIFAVFAGILVFRGSEGQGPAFADGTSNVMQNVLILIVAAISVAVVFYLKKVFEQQTQILRRLEIIELVSREGVPVERDEASDPNDSLPIGSPFPEFSLPNLTGRMVTLEHVLTRGKPILFFFVSPTCSPCAALLPDIKKWQEELAGKVEFVLVSSGTASANAEKFGGEFAGDVLLQKDGEVSDAVRARWTPTAILVRNDGTIASHVSAGDSAIKALVETVASQNVGSDLFYIANGSAAKIGEVAPQFSLDTAAGSSVSSDSLIGRKTLAVFWSQTCPHCKNMIEDLRNWDETREPTEPALMVFADGEPGEHAAIGLRSPIIMDSGYETAMKLGMSGTPSAVLIDESGRIVTETAVGAANIWALIGRKVK